MKASVVPGVEVYKDKICTWQTRTILEPVYTEVEKTRHNGIELTLKLSNEEAQCLANIAALHLSNYITGANFSKEATRSKDLLIGIYTELMKAGFREKL